MAFFGLYWLQRPNLNCLFRAPIHEGFYQFGYATISGFRDYSRLGTNRNQLINIYLIAVFFESPKSWPFTLCLIKRIVAAIFRHILAIDRNAVRLSEYHRNYSLGKKDKDPYNKHYGNGVTLTGQNLSSK